MDEIPLPEGVTAVADPAVITPAECPKCGEAARAFSVEYSVETGHMASAECANGHAWPLESVHDRGVQVWPPSD